MARHISWCIAALVLCIGADAAADCPWAHGAGDRYIHSQFGKHIGGSTHVSATPQNRIDHAHLSPGYGQHLGTRKRSRRNP